MFVKKSRFPNVNKSLTVGISHHIARCSVCGNSGGMDSSNQIRKVAKRSPSGPLPQADPVFWQRSSLHPCVLRNDVASVRETVWCEPRGRASLGKNQKQGSENQYHHRIVHPIIHSRKVGDQQSTVSGYFPGVQHATHSKRTESFSNSRAKTVAFPEHLVCKDPCILAGIKLEIFLAMP